MGFAKEEYWSGLPFPTPRDLPDPGIKATSPAWQADSLPLNHLGSPWGVILSLHFYLLYGFEFVANSKHLCGCPFLLCYVCLTIFFLVWFTMKISWAKTFLERAEVETDIFTGRIESGMAKDLSSGFPILEASSPRFSWARALCEQGFLSSQLLKILSHLIISSSLKSCWERLRARGEGGDREWDGWMASLTQWTWVWANSGRWWRTGKPGMPKSMGL